MIQRNFNTPKHKHLRQQLRTNMTTPEKILWHKIIAKQLGVKFRRQHGIGNYIVDFYCPEKRIVIEIDGESHFTQFGEDSDIRRDEFLRNLKIKVLRYTNVQVMKEIDSVIEDIYLNISK